MLLLVIFISLCYLLTFFNVLPYTMNMKCMRIYFFPKHLSSMAGKFLPQSDGH